MANSKAQIVVYLERVPKTVHSNYEGDQFDAVRVEGTMSPLPGDRLLAEQVQALMNNPNVRVVIDKRRSR